MAISEAVNEIGRPANNRAGRDWIRNWRRRNREHQRSNPLGYLFIAPAVILYLVFNIWPMIRGLLMAFTDYRFVYPETQWAFNGLNNFTKILADKKVMAALGVTLKYTLIVLPTVLILSLFVAVLISRARRLAGFYRWIVYLPSILPIAVSFLMFRELFNAKFGFVNQTLINLGMTDPPQWLNQVNTALPTIGFAHVWIIFGFPTLLFLVGIYNIGSELYEAASLDGANGFQQFRFITLPLLRRTFATILVLLLPALIAVTDPMLILSANGVLGSPQDSTKTLGLYVYQIAFLTGDLRLGYASAISLVSSIGVSLMVLVIFFLLRERTGGRKTARVK